MDTWLLPVPGVYVFVVVVVRTGVGAMAPVQLVLTAVVAVTAAAAAAAVEVVSSSGWQGPLIGVVVSFMRSEFAAAVGGTFLCGVSG